MLCDVWHGGDGKFGLAGDFSAPFVKQGGTSTADEITNSPIVDFDSTPMTLMTTFSP